MLKEFVVYILYNKMGSTPAMMMTKSMDTQFRGLKSTVVSVNNNLLRDI